LYGIETSYFYTNEEDKINNKLNKLYIRRFSLESKKLDESLKRRLEKNEKILKIRKKQLEEKIKESGLITRELRVSKLRKKDIISVFESTLTRTIGISKNNLTDELLIVRVFYFEIFESLVKNGFYWNNELYVSYTASAGQIRTKKNVFIKKSTLDKHNNTLTCGLSLEEINNRGGVNTNKYLAYLALNNSATDRWENFDITKSIVVDDFETLVNDTVDYIDYQTFEITRQKIDVPIPQMDGCGIFLPSISKKAKMFRMPWVKGLLVPFDFKQFIIEHEQKNPNARFVKDIYGKEYDIINDDIQFILTKSQFKMHKYYDSWQQYIDNYLKYNCETGYTNEEVDRPKDANINYQMLQTLTDITNEEIEKITHKTINKINNIGNDKRIMLKLLGANKENYKKNYYQRALEIYPELLKDKHNKEILKNIKKSMVKHSKYGKIHIDGKYTFIIPDLYAFSEWLFLKIEKPNGLLKYDECSCKLYKDKKLALLRAPHLYREWGIKNNTHNENINKWFITNGVYVNTHDLLSKLLAFDVDGDSSLVVRDKLLVEIGERNMKGIVPLHYEMQKANPMIINNESIYEGLKTAYSTQSIGYFSNTVTKIWNSDDVNLDAIKWLCMIGNYSIDSAKTMYILKIPNIVNDILKKYTIGKVPHFFKYAKDKEEFQVSEINKNTILGKIEMSIPDKRLYFEKEVVGKLDYKFLMSNPKIKPDVKIIELYTKLDKEVRFNKPDDYNYETNEIPFIYNNIRKEILEANNDIKYVTDILVKYLYKIKDSKWKSTLWHSFGDILLDNIDINLKLHNFIICEKCGTKVEKTSNKIKYCKECAEEINRKKTRENMKNIRKK
jgi:hypothetical protein